MGQKQAHISTVDPVWDAIKAEGQEIIAAEPAMAGVVYGAVLHHKTLESALAYRIA